jgi:hypothetical protein
MEVYMKLTVRGKVALGLFIFWVLLLIIGLSIPKDRTITIETNPSSFTMVQDTIARDNANRIGER